MTTTVLTSSLPPPIAAAKRANRQMLIESALSMIRHYSKDGIPYNNICKLIEYCTDRVALQVEDGTPCFQVFFDHSEVESGEADEVLAATEQLLADNGLEYVRLLRSIGSADDEQNGTAVEVAVYRSSESLKALMEKMSDKVLAGVRDSLVEAMQDPAFTRRPWASFHAKRGSKGKLKHY